MVGPAIFFGINRDVGAVKKSQRHYLTQIKRWSRNKKQALIEGNLEELRRFRGFYFANSPSFGK